MARLSAVFNFNFTILHVKVANNYLIPYEHLGRYLEGFWTIILSIFEFFSASECIVDGEREVAWFRLLHAILLTIFVTSLVHCVTIILFCFVFRF